MNSNNRIGRIDYSSDRKDEAGITIHVEELMDSAYGYYIWPSSLVLSKYVWCHRNLFKNKTVLEVGAGTSLPSLVLTKIDPAPHVVITDVPSIIPVARSCLKLNGIITTKKDDTTYLSLTLPLWVRGLEWGDIGSANGIKQLLDDINTQWHHRNIDYIFGSDTFYDPPDFEKLLMTVAYVIHRHNSNCKFITAYQERSSKRSIQFLLDKWSLQCRLIPRDSFGFDGGRFESDDDSIEDDTDTTTTIPHIKMNASTVASVFLLEITAKS
ncbi:hypothetical protein BC941DRAFT_419294 [Chlamydoabsidia padenii]|nr:hypothetical protein BC941DRAFT_419294 [Chlamydoabsidia padenii]